MVVSWWIVALCPAICKIHLKVPFHRNNLAFKQWANLKLQKHQTESLKFKLYTTTVCSAPACLHYGVRVN